MNATRLIEILKNFDKLTSESSENEHGDPIIYFKQENGELIQISIAELTFSSDKDEKNKSSIVLS